MTRKNSRQIGKRFEIKIANWLKRWWPNAARSYGQSRQGSDAADVEHTPFWVECKCCQRISDNKLESIYYDTFDDACLEAVIREDKFEKEHNKQIIIENRPVLLIYKNKSKSKTGPKGFSYIRVILNGEYYNDLARKARHYDYNKHRRLGYVYQLAEIELDNLGFLFDLIYGSKEAIK